MPSFPPFSPTRIRSYVLRLPFATRVLLAAILGLWVATIPFPWIRDFGQLEPAKMDLSQSTWSSYEMERMGEGEAEGWSAAQHPEAMRYRHIVKDKDR